ncbi:MAG: RagB/SusD family nutrient uptake outer membrane protein [Paludibacteraceae bacterium]|nr:RagB/SusD family nutrient uptake outer membrane protein [Paludibacteraceae bacterium]
MKTISRILVLVFGVLFFAGCTDLNTFPEGGTKTESQKQAAIKNNPELLAADVSAIYATMIELFAGLGEANEYHSDFGYASLAIIMDANGQDVTCPSSGYNWFSRSFSYADRVYTSAECLMTWKVYYKIIRAANAVLGVAPADAEDDILKAYRGQALAARAFAYLNMAQLYQFKYKGNENKPCVPIVSENMTSEQQMKNPRATVQEVYDSIMSDLNEAVTLLNNYKRSDKSMIDQAVAYGLRARANLVQENWAEAAADAKQALEVSGATPYTLAEVSKPTFTSADANSVLWANIITETNDVVTSGIINWPSHVSSLFSDGYTGVGAYKSISVLLYNKIADTDVRKGWWLNEEFDSPLLSSDIYSGWKKDNAEACGYLGNVKFGVYQDNMVNLVAASDWILMRAEEMLLIQAEGLAMSGEVADAKTALENFVKTYRDPSYTCQAADAKTLQDEIWLQRRIELWGEGFSFFDIMRLEKPITRKENGESSYPDAWQFNIPAKSQILLYLIPRSEIESNQGIDESQNNPAVNPPVA